MPHPRGTTGRVSGGTRYGVARRRSRPESPRRTSSRCNGSRCSSTAPPTPRRSISTTSGSAAHARRLLRHDDVRQDRRDRRGEREGAVAVHAAGLLRLGGLGADHDGHTGGRPEPAVDLRGCAERPHLQARRRERSRSVERVDHEASVAREDRGRAELRERARDRDDRRLHRRRAAVPGSRRDHQSRRCAPPRVELALLGPARSHRSRELPGERFGDLGSRGRRRRPGERPAARRDRQCAVGREDELGRRGASPLGRRDGDCSATTRRRTPKS